MPKVVKLPKGREFIFKAADKNGRVSKYDWDSWFKGDLIMLEQSVGKKDDKGNTLVDATGTPVPDKDGESSKRDYDVATDFMPPKLKFAARKRYKVVQISRLDADGKKLEDALIIKARDMDADERAAEDIRRAEEKAARLAAKEDSNTAENAGPGEGDDAE